MLILTIGNLVQAQEEKESGEGLPAQVEAFRNVIRSVDVDTYSDAALELRHFMMKNDPYYPVYHFTPPESWMNDPNGPIYYRERYHLFYQFDPQIPAGKARWVRSRRAWGHAVSDDLVHWRDWPVAVWPDSPFDSAGVYSGNTFTDERGDLCGIYTGNVSGHRETYGLLIRSRDNGRIFDKKIVMMNSQRPNTESPVHWDGQIWKNEDTWYQLIGGTTGGENTQGAAWLWSSPNFESWTLEGNIAPELRVGNAKFWELPYLIELDGKHVLFVGSGNSYWIGEFDYNSMEFRADDPEPRSIDRGMYYSFNLNMADDKGPGGSPRQLMHGWITTPMTITESVPWWQGAHSIPRVISLKNNRVWQEPIPEIAGLRGQHHHCSGGGAESQVRQIRGDVLEIMASFNPGAKGIVGLRFRVSDDGEDYVRAYFDPATRTFGVDGPTITRNQEEIQQRSFYKPRPVYQEIEMGDGDRIDMHIFLDRSVLEMYINGYAITACFFSFPEAMNIEIEGEPDQLESMEVWEMGSMWDRVVERLND